MARCLIVEKHAWETGAHQHQLQIPLADALDFFGPGNRAIDITLNMFAPGDDTTPDFIQEVSISKVYQTSRTRRLNRFHRLGLIGPCFMFFQQTDDPVVFDFWWEPDKAIVAARFADWHQGHSSQYGRGRLVTIVDAPVPKWFTRIDE